MNKRKKVWYCALGLAIILVIMTSVPVYRGYRSMKSQWQYLFGDDSDLIFGIIGSLIMITAFVFVILAYRKPNRVKRYITLSVASTWLSGIVIAIDTLLHTDGGIIPIIAYTVLCAPVLIWNLRLKDEPAAQSTVQSGSTQNTSTAPSGASYSESGVHSKLAADSGRQKIQKNYVEDRPMTKKDAEGLLAYIWVRQYNTLPYEEALDKIMAYLIENRYVIASETGAANIDAAATNTETVVSKSVEPAADGGKSSVGNAEISKNLRLARQAREENNAEDAKTFYGKVREEDPENGEAKFYYAYYSLQEGTNGELPTRFENLCTVLPVSIRLIKNSALDKDAQLKIIEDIAKTFAPETWSEITYMIHKNVEDKVGDSYVTVFDSNAELRVYNAGRDALNSLGGQISALYDNDPECKRIACIAYEEYIKLLNNWYDYHKVSAGPKTLQVAFRELGDKVGDDPAFKEIAIAAWSSFVTLAQKFYAYVEKGDAEKYAEKIKKLDPSYVMPAKSGCISKA